MEIEDLILPMRRKENEALMRELIEKLMHDDDFLDFLNFNYRIISSPTRIDESDDRLLIARNIGLVKRNRVCVNEWENRLTKLHEMDAKGNVVTKSQLEAKFDEVLED